MTKVLSLFDHKLKFWLNWGILMFIFHVYESYYLAHIKDYLTNVEVTYAVISNSLLAIIIIHFVSSLNFWLCKKS